jgi:hypothetical protein
LITARQVRQAHAGWVHRVQPENLLHLGHHLIEIPRLFVQGSAGKMNFLFISQVPEPPLECMTYDYIAIGISSKIFFKKVSNFSKKSL